MVSNVSRMPALVFHHDLCFFSVPISNRKVTRCEGMISRNQLFLVSLAGIGSSLNGDTCFARSWKSLVEDSRFRVFHLVLE